MHEHGHSYDLLVGSYANADQAGILAFRYDSTARTLTPRGSHTGIVNPSFLVIHPNGRWIYAVSETSANDGAPGRVWSLRIGSDDGDGSVTFEALDQQPSGGDWPCHLQLDASARWLFVANYGSGSMSVLPIQADGSLGAMTDLVQHQGSGTNPRRQEGPHAHSTTITPDGQCAVVADLGIDRLVVYRFDAETGKLAHHTDAAARPGAGPRHMAFHPSGQILYVANELDSTVSVYNYDATNGSFYERQTLSTLPTDVPDNTVADIHVAPSGDELIVSNRGHESLAIYTIKPDGALALRTITSCGGSWPRNFAFAPDGQAVLVANQYSDNVVVLTLPDGTPDEQVSVLKASCIQFMPKADQMR